MKKNNNFETFVIKEITSMKVDISWIKRVIFLLLGVMIANLFVLCQDLSPDTC